jgi:ATP-dependent RNA helicase DHX57
VLSGIKSLYYLFRPDSEETFKPAKDSVHDERLSMKQILHRFGPVCDEQACGVIYRMDVEKINYDLLEAVLVFIVEGEHAFPREGSIVVFLPGMQEISTLHDQLSAHPLLGKKANKFELIPLHSSLSSEEQARVFAR